MNEKDIKKCIKNGYCWASCGKSPDKIVRGKITNDKNWRTTLDADNIHATKSEAQLAISTRREQARVEERKKEGTQVPPPETKEQRDARLKATYEGYCKAGGPITKEQLTKEMHGWLRSKGEQYYAVRISGDKKLHEVTAYFFATNTAVIGEGLTSAFWTRADAEHDHFLRTWKGPLTEEAAKKLRNGDDIWTAMKDGTVVTSTWKFGFISNWNADMYLSESEAMQAAHDLWLADRREKQTNEITEDQKKILHGSDLVYYASNLGLLKTIFLFAKASKHKTKYYFSAMAAQAALDKAKQHEASDKPSPTEPVASHKTPSGESQSKEVSTGETQNTKDWTDILQTLTPRNDSVIHPSHYTTHPSGVECITITKHMNFCRGNAVKYIWRAGQKGNSIDKEIEDIAKAEEYCRIEKERLIEMKKKGNVK